MKIVRSLLVLLCAAAPLTSFAQGAWPQRPLRIVVPYNAGGAGDSMARAIGKELARTLGQPVTVENKPGASGMIGTTAVAQSRADSHVLLMGSSAEISINPSLYRSVAYSSSDLQPVAFAGKLPLVLVTAAANTVGSLSQLVDAARQKPGQITFASAGAGQTAHLAMEVVMQKTGVKMLHVPYKGGSEAVMAVVAGQADLFFSGLPPALPQIAGGKLKPLVVSSADRVAQLPHVPTVAESGIPGFDISNWFAVFVPAGVPPEIIAKLHKAINDALHAAEVKALFHKQGIVAQRMSTAQLQDFVDSETKKYKALLAATNIKLD